MELPRLPNTINTYNLADKIKIKVYLIKDVGVTTEEVLCKLTEKVFPEMNGDRGDRIIVYCDENNNGKDLLRSINSKLWTFSQSAFVPHAFADQVEAKYSSVVLECFSKFGEFSDTTLGLQNFKNIIIASNNGNPLNCLQVVQNFTISEGNLFLIYNLYNNPSDSNSLVIQHLKQALRDQSQMQINIFKNGKWSKV